MMLWPNFIESNKKAQNVPFFYLKINFSVTFNTMMLIVKKVKDTVPNTINTLGTED